MTQRSDFDQRIGMATIARAVGIMRPGGVDALRVIERSVREPGPGEVRLAVKAAAVNPADTQMREGGVEGLAPPWVPGMDAAGLVESIGKGAHRLGVGQAVMAAVAPRRPEGGAQAELVVVPAASVVAIPEGATLEQSATLPMNGLAGFLGLELLDLARGQTLAVSGGAGLLASYVIAVANTRGLRVVVDASPHDETLVRGFGADIVLPRGDDYPAAVRDVTADGADGFFDTARLNRAAFPAIRNGGALVVVRGWNDGEPERGIQIRTMGVSNSLHRTDWLEELRELASEEKIQLRVATTAPPEQAAEAHTAIEAGGLRGRAVIVF